MRVVDQADDHRRGSSMNATTLFDSVDELERRVRSMDPETSWTAASAMSTPEYKGLKADIFRILSDHGPLTDDALYARYVAEGGTRTPKRVRTARAEMSVPYRGQVPRLRAADDLGVSEHGGTAQQWEVIP